jgi:uncharacterized protein
MPEESRKTRSLDPRAPLVIDTRELGRRPGSMRTVSRTVPAPADLGIDVLAVPEASDLELDLRLEAVMEGVLVSGTARARLVGECVRCLDPVEQELVTDLQELFAYPGGDRAEEGSDADAPDLLEMEGDLLDLEPVVRDAVVLELPFQPLCREDCPGLCTECGARLADQPEHAHEATDPRWSALEKLISPDARTGGGTARPEES